MEQKHMRRENTNLLEALFNTNVESMKAAGLAAAAANNNIVTDEEMTTSYEQIKFFKESADKLLKMKKAGKALQGDETFLQHGRELKNYKIEYVGNYINIWDKHNKFKYGYFSLGNKKLKSTEFKTFVIWNVLQQTSCKYATQYCLESCYADKYPNNLDSNIISRAKNLILSTFTNFEDIFNQVLEIVNKVYKGTVINVRYHESGDIYNRQYALKLKRIAANNAAVHNNNFLIYTKNIEVLPELKDTSSNFMVRFSIMPDTPQDVQVLALNQNSKFFICLEDTQNMDHVPRCNNKCSTCSMCQNEAIRTIIVKKH